MGFGGGRQSNPSAMLAGVQPCFQLLRIGSSAGDSARDLYTFRPALSQSVFRLGRAPELCDVTLDSESVSRIHAELHAEKEAGAGDAPELEEEGWRVHVKDRSSHGNRDTHRCASTSQSETSLVLHCQSGRERKKQSETPAYKKYQHRNREAHFKSQTLHTVNIPLTVYRQLYTLRNAGFNTHQLV